jgi:hypothetical protein
MTSSKFSWSNPWFRAAVIILLLSYAVIESFAGRNDWDIFIAASRALKEGVDVYAITYFDGYHYYYSLLFATVLYPFTFLPAAAGKFVWICINMLMMTRVLLRIMSFFNERLVSNQVRHWFFLLLFLGGLRLIKSNVHLGQSTILLLFLTMEALHWDEHKKSFRAGVLLSLAINIKLLPAVLVPYWIYRARLKSALIAGAFIIFWWILPCTWLGYERTAALMHSYFELVNPTQQRHILDVEETSFHGLSTLLSTLFSSEAREHNGLNLRRNLFDCSLNTLSVIILGVRLLFVVFTLFFLRTWPFRSAATSLHRNWELSYVLLIIPLIAPHQQHYAFLFALPAIAYVAYFLLTQRLKYSAWMWTVFIFALITFNLALWLGVFNAIYNHYKILTYGALALVMLLAFLAPTTEIKKVGTSPTFES